MRNGMNNRLTAHGMRARRWRTPGASADAGRRGAVLLEAVLAIPLLMVLIGGILWVGDLSLARQRLVVADRYAAWNGGNRFRNEAGNAPDIQAEVQQRIFAATTNQIVTVQLSNERANHWQREVWGGANLRARMPVWTEAWLSIGDAMWGGGATGVITNTVPSMHGRLIPPGPSGMYEGHRVVLRSAFDDGRGGPGSALADMGAEWPDQAWHTIYSGEWMHE